LGSLVYTVLAEASEAKTKALPNAKIEHLRSCRMREPSVGFRACFCKVLKTSNGLQQFSRQMIA
jgi:hypothetical protein